MENNKISDKCRQGK